MTDTTLPMKNEFIKEVIKHFPSMKKTELIEYYSKVRLWEVLLMPAQHPEVTKRNAETADELFIWLKN